MNSRLMRDVLLIGLCLSATEGWASAETKRSQEWQTYRSPDYGFTIAYPVSMAFSSGHPVKAPELSMFPIYEGPTIACFQYDGNEFEKTAVQAAGISVKVLRGFKSEKDCNTMEFGSGPTGTIKIHGVLFHYGDMDEAGGGSSIGATEYRTFYQHVCFDVSVAMAMTDIAAEHEEDEGYRPVNKRAWRRLWKNMDRMLHSFRFVGPVQDGPDWNVYFDQGCGYGFEYPSASTLRQLKDYSNQAQDSKGIACEQAFTYNDREYTIAAKVNVRNEVALDEWLSAAGYPARNRMKAIAMNNDFTEYSDQTYTYLRHNLYFFIFTVSGESHRPISSEGDRVFAHLLGSFEI
ncbi:MAG: hypothetical protein WCA10_11115 [Terracidiphilus sp.]